MGGSQITLEGKDGRFQGYLSVPESRRGPGLIVIQEIFGINQVMRDIADAYAARGFFALAPDLFWRLEPGVELTDKTDAEWKRAFDLMTRFDIDKGITDIATAINYTRHLSGCTGKVGAVGYCLGGQLAYLTACRTDADACVGYYGVNIQDRLAEARTIRAPLMLHIAGKDQFVPPEAQEKITEELKVNPLITLHHYPTMDHAFARQGGTNYDQACADLANTRSTTFLRQHLS